MIEDGQGCCFGFAVRSHLSLHFLRTGGGDTLDVTGPSGGGIETLDQLVYEWPPTPEMPSHVRLYRDRTGRRYGLNLSGQRWIVIDPAGRRIELPAGGDPLEDEQRLWRVPGALCFQFRGDLPLHAAAVQVGGSALVLAAPGHYGKTTLAAGFHKAGYRVLSEDITCIRLSPTASVIPGPALLRVRRDVFEALNLSDVEAVAENDQRVVLEIVSTRRGDCRPVPVAAVVILRPGSEEIIAEPVRPFEAIRDLMALSFKVKAMPQQAKAFEGIAELTRGVPVFDLHRPLRMEEVVPTVDHIVSLIGVTQGRS